MNCRSAVLKIVSVAGILGFAAALPVAAQQTPDVKTVEQVFKNIQVLNGTPADQLFPTMHVFSGALGVRCQFCHVDGDYSSDAKREKATARKMIAMMMDINKTNFNGQQQVTCYTCHNGHNNPANVPALPTSENAEPPRPTMPAADDILSKYIQAIGGEQAIRKITSRVIIGTQDLLLGPPSDRTTTPAQVEIDQKAPNLVVSMQHTDKSATSNGFDGTMAWTKDMKGTVSDLANPYQMRSKQTADFYEPLDLKQEYPRMQVRGIQKVNDHDAYQLICNPANDSPERLFFDTQTGLLLRKMTVIMTPGGNYPIQVDYDDYRDTGSGVKIPFTIHMIPGSQGNSLSTETTLQIQKVQDNVAIPDSKFAKP